MLALPTDVGHRDQVDRSVAATVERFGRLDVLVNAAGLNTQHRRMSDLVQAEWDRILATLPPRTYVPELIMMPPQLQVVGQAMA